MFKQWPSLCALFVTAALLAAGAVPVVGSAAWSAETGRIEIRVLPSVEVKQKEVFLADICDPGTGTAQWRSLAARLNIGEAPAAGSEKFIDPGQLRSYITRQLESDGIEASTVKLDIPDRIVVRRESVRLSHEQIEEIFKAFVLENSPWKGQEINIQRVFFSGIPLVPAGQLTHRVVPSSPNERYIGNMTATIELYVNGEKARSLPVSARIEVFGNVYLASRPLRQNDILRPGDLEIRRINLTDAADKFATQADQVENRRVMRNIGMHQPIELRYLDKPLVLKRGDPVTIVYDLPGLQVTAKGQANSDGGVGDTLAVVNVSSKKTIHCKVVDSQTVRAVR